MQNILLTIIKFCFILLQMEESTFRHLVKDLAAIFKTTDRACDRLASVMRQRSLAASVSVADVSAAILTLSEFAPVSIKMAKEQNLSLNQTKISGVCGRLMCCLKNEQETYEELNKKLPGTGDTVTTS